MEKLIYVDRRNTNCNKWDGQYKMFGEEVEEYIEDTRSIPRKISNATDRAILNERLKVETGNNTINEHNNTK